MNQEFLQALFKEDAPFVHVTDFAYDPNNIPSDRHLVAWKGDWFSRYRMAPGANQYFTISIFNPDERSVARRRKALYLRTRVIVLDDVREKLSMDAVGRLPEPAWILETSPGSEQWGYILTEPCHDRGRVENLLDGLVANGLAPDGKDPGMKGVTRYVRLPDGCNTKASKMIDGKPFQCHLKEWHPSRTTTLEALALPFNVNLDAVRREARVDGAADIPDHPLLQIPDIIHIKEVRSNGRFDITCPWIDEHTGGDDSGTAIFTNDDGSIGYKCHHGGCSDRTARDLVRYIEDQSPGFGEVFSGWRMQRVFADIKEEPSFLGTPTIPDPPREISFLGTTVPTPPAPPTMDDLLNALKRERHTSAEARSLAGNILRLVEDFRTMDQNHWHKEVCDMMHWSKQDFKGIIKDLRSDWYNNAIKNDDFLEGYVYVADVDKFYNQKSGGFVGTTGLRNSLCHLDADVLNTALDNPAAKTDTVDFAPKEPAVFTKNGIRYCNLWIEPDEIHGKKGDCTPWLDHWDKLGWGEYRDHHLKWMAFTMKHPDQKINHMIILGGREGIGKDFMLQPFIDAMGKYSTTIQGNELLSSFDDYLLCNKHLHINETELSDHGKATEVSNKLKPLATAPPNTFRVNQKNIGAVSVRNIINCTMTTNSQTPIKLTGPSRRFHAAWSDLSVRDSDLEMIPEWKEYWNNMWKWMSDGGAEYCIDYLLNEVDISDFNPGEAPPMTQFLRDITDSSKSPAERTLESFIIGKIGAFASDLATCSDMMNTLKAATITHPDLLQYEKFHASLIGKVMNNINQCIKRQCNKGGVYVRVWILRDTQKYMSLTGASLYEEYEKQMAACRDPHKLQIVK